MRLSIAIPTYEMGGLGAYFLRRCLKSLQIQTFKDFEVVMSDNSKDNSISNVLSEFPDLQINYFTNDRIGMSKNTNYAIQASKGELIKILYMDDFLASESSLQEISDDFASDDNWLVTGCLHTTGGDIERPHYPYYNDQIHEGKNTIGSPSVLTIKNEGHLLFDEDMVWVLDCDLYKRYYETFGLPKILESLNVVIGQHDAQATNTMGEDAKEVDYKYINKKYDSRT